MTADCTFKQSAVIAVTYLVHFNPAGILTGYILLLAP